MEKVYVRLDEESRRSSEVIPKYSFDWPQIQKATEVALLEKRLPWLSTGLETSVDEEKIDGLVRMYELFKRVGGLELLCEKFKAHVNKVVVSIIKDQERDDELVDRLLKFKAFIDRAAVEAFHSSRPFLNAVNDAFSKGFKIRKIKPAEMIAKYLDREMKRGQKEASDEEFRDKLDAVLGLYRFTEGQLSSSFVFDISNCDIRRQGRFQDILSPRPREATAS